MNTTRTRTKRLLVTAIGAAVVGISLGAAPAAIAEQSAPNPPVNHIPSTPVGLLPPPPAVPPSHNVVISPPGKYVLPPNKTQGGWK